MPNYPVAHFAFLIQLPRSNPDTQKRLQLNDRSRDNSRITKITEKTIISRKFRLRAEITRAGWRQRLGRVSEPSDSGRGTSRSVATGAHCRWQT